MSVQISQKRMLVRRQASNLMKLHFPLKVCVVTAPLRLHLIKDGPEFIAGHCNQLQTQ